MLLGHSTVKFNPVMIVISDNGSQFVARDFKEFIRINRIVSGHGEDTKNGNNGPWFLKIDCHSREWFIGAAKLASLAPQVLSSISHL